MYANSDKSIAVEVICLTINFYKFDKIVIRSLMTRGAIIILTFSIFGCVPCALCHAFFIEEVCNSVYCIFTGHSNLVIILKEMPFFFNLVPSAGKLAKLRETVCRNCFIIEQAGVFCLTCANTILAKVIVITVYKLYAGEHNTVGIIAIAYPTANNCAVHICFAVGINTAKQFSTRAFE